MFSTPESLKNTSSPIASFSGSTHDYSSAGLLPGLTELSQRTSNLFGSSIGTAILTGTLDSTDPINPNRSGRFRDDYFLTNVSKGQQIQVNLISIFDNYLQLVNADTGAVITENDDFIGPNAQLTFRVESDTRYIIRTTSYASAATGSYILSTTRGIPTPSTPISGSQSFSGTLVSTDPTNSLRPNTYYDGYALTGVSAGQEVRVNLNGAFDTYLQLVNARTNQVLASNDDFNGTLNSEINFTVQSGIDYIIRATSFDSKATGSYSLTTNTGTFIADNQLLNGSLSTSDRTNPTRSGTLRDDYLLNGLTVGQQIRVNMDSLDFDTYLQLVDTTTNQVIAFNDDFNGTLDAEINFTVEAGRSYLIRATSYASAATGSYSLTTNTGTFIANNQLLNGSLSTTDRTNPTRGTLRDDYLLNGLTVGQQIRVNMDSLDFDTYLQLVDTTTNQVIAFNDDSNGTLNSEINFTVEAGRSYLIRATSYSNATGGYTLATSGITIPGFNSNYGYGLVDAAAAVASAIGQSPFSDVPNLGGNDWGRDIINAPEAWNQGYTGQGTVVAVVDTGIDYNHIDLDANIWTNTREIAGNGVDDDSNGFVDDVRGWDFVDRDSDPMDLESHGTHVAGIIAAENNGVGITGVAYNARLMPVRVLDEYGGGYWSDVAAGIRYAANNGANIINLSLGGFYSSEVEDAVRYATARSSIVVMAAGNEYANQPGFPANLANRWGIAVGAVDSNKRIANFSNLAGTTLLDYVVAPGVGVLSTTPNNTYQSFSGTSMAAPHVAGVAALILSANRNLTPAQVENILTETANPTGITV